MTTQVPALSAMTFGHASHNSVRSIGPSTSAFLAGGDGDVGHHLSLGPIYLPRRDTS